MVVKYCFLLPISLITLKSQYTSLHSFSAAKSFPLHDLALHLPYKKQNTSYHQTHDQTCQDINGDLLNHPYHPVTSVIYHSPLVSLHLRVLPKIHSMNRQTILFSSVQTALCDNLIHSLSHK